MSLKRTESKPAEASAVCKLAADDISLVFDELPDSAYVREAQLVKSSKPSNPKRPKSPPIFPFSSATLWRKVSDGSFPKPVKLSSRVTAWQVGSIRKFIKEISASEVTK